MENPLDLFLRRRSIRKFTDQPVEKEKLIDLIKAGMSGPSAMNAQPWEFVIITEAEILAKFRAALMFAKMEAPAAICVLGSSRKQKGLSGEKFWVQDCSAATENILLAATAMGLGSVWIGVHPVYLFEQQVKNILNLPAGVKPLNLIYIGYPAEEKEPRTQYDETRVHWGAFPKKGSKKKESSSTENQEE